MAGVDGKDGVPGLQASNRRQHPRQFLIPGDRLGTRACRFPAYVDDRRSGGNHLAAGGNGACRRVVAAPIRKTVGGDIQDAHDPGLVHGQPGKGGARRGDQFQRCGGGIPVACGLDQPVRIHAAGRVGTRIITLHKVNPVETGPAAGDGVPAMRRHDRAYPCGNAEGRGRQFRRPPER